MSLRVEMPLEDSRSTTRKHGLIMTFFYQGKRADVQRSENALTGQFEFLVPE
jgi:hypothetical protein